jgi:hypothetical protein
MKKQNQKTRNKQKTFISDSGEVKTRVHPSPLHTSVLLRALRTPNGPLPQCRQKIEKKNEGLGE